MPADLDLDSVNEELSLLEPADILRWAARTFADRLCLQSSMQRRGSAIVHMLCSSGLTQVPILFVDTGYHFVETLETRDRLAAEYRNPIVTLNPEESPQTQTDRFGRELWRHPDGYETCCALRKVQPFLKAVRGHYDAVISGLQRSEGGVRAALPMIGRDPRIDAYIVYPLAAWDRQDVDAYNERHDVFVHPLHGRGYPSIGCQTCTTPVLYGEPERAGRWRHIREAINAEQEPLYCDINWVDRKR